MKTSHWGKLCAILAVASVLAGYAHAETFNVTASSPGIQQAINSASDGDTILVAPGIYTENIDFNGKRLTLKSTGGADQTAINGIGGTTVNIGASSRIEGFTIRGGTAAFGAGMSVSGVGTVISGNIFELNNQGAGGYGAAIGGNTASPIISGNIFRNNSADNQFLSGVVSFINVSSPQIFNNLFYDNDARAINFTAPSSALPVVANNTIVGNRSGIYIDGRIGLSPQVFANNILAHNGIGFESSFAGNVVPAILSHNLVTGNRVDFQGLPNVVGLSGNIAGDPLFVNLTNYDFHLAPGSAALSMGIAQYAPVFDYDGVLRSTVAPSIGAFELATAVPEAGTLLLMFVGLLFVKGAASRRR